MIETPPAYSTNFYRELVKQKLKEGNESLQSCANIFNEFHLTPNESPYINKPSMDARQSFIDEAMSSS